MAGKGTYGAYRQLNPIQADFGNPMERYAQRMMQIQDRDLAYKEARRKEAQAILDKFGEDMSTLEQVVTGVQSIDEVNYDYFNQGQRQLGDMYRQLRENPALARNPQFMMRKQQILRSPQILKAFQEKTTARIEQLTQGLADGTLSKAMEAELEELRSYYGVKQEDGSYAPNFVLRYDKMGNTHAIVKRPDGKLVTRSAPSVINGFEYSEDIQNVNANELAENFRDKVLGKDQELVRVSGGIATMQQWDQAKENFTREYFRGQLTQDGEPSAMAKSLWVDSMGNESLDNIDLKAVEDYMTQQVANGYDRTVTGYSRDPQSSTSPYSKYAQEVFEVQSRINLMTDDDGAPLTLQSTGTAPVGPKRPGEGDYIGFNIPGDKFKLRLGEGGETFVNSIYYDKKSGKMMVRGLQRLAGPTTVTRQLKEFETGQTYPKYDNRYLNKEEMNNLANALYFKSTTELKRYLNSLTNSQRSGIEWK